MMQDCHPQAMHLGECHFSDRICGGVEQLLTLELLAC
jgi:hypothetical protein